MARPPFSFTELRNSVFYHNIKVFIFGADVTPWLTGALTFSRAGRNGTNTCQFTLSNPLDAFSMTSRNLTPADGVDFSRDDAILTGQYRTIDPSMIGGAYSELAKFQIISRKLSDQALNLKHQVETFGLIGQNLSDREHTRDSSQVQSEFTDRYPFSEGSLCIHKHDPVRVFIQNPFQRGDDAWTCEFTGYIDTKPYSQNYVNGLSQISVTCQDIRLLMQGMRVQVNPSSLIGNENTLLFREGSLDNVRKSAVLPDDTNFFEDFLATRTGLSHVLGGQTFQQSIETLLFGDAENASTRRRKEQGTGSTDIKRGGVGNLSKGLTFNFDPEQSAEDFFENWNNLIIFGDRRKQLGSGTLGGYLTELQVDEMGSQTFPGGEWSPDNSLVHFLFPAEGSPLSNLVSFAKGDANVIAKIEWESRLDLITKVCSSIDYQMYVTGLGDIVFEFPFYDFLPNSFGEVYKELYVFHRHLIQDTINDEGGEPIAALRLSSHRLNEEELKGNPEKEGNSGGVATSAEVVRTIFSNVMASRYGAHVETLSFPGIRDHNRLTQLGFIEFNKRIAKFNKFGFDATFRPYLGINRPIFHGAKQRFGISESVVYTYQIRGEVTMTLDLSYTRKKEKDGFFRFITGGERVPISYNTIYDRNQVFVKNQGVTADKEPDSAPSSTPASKESNPG